MGIVSIVRNCWKSLGSIGRSAALISMLGLPAIFGGGCASHPDEIDAIKPKDLGEYTKKEADEEASRGKQVIPKTLDEELEGLRGKEGDVRSGYILVGGHRKSISLGLIEEPVSAGGGMLIPETFGNATGALRLGVGYLERISVEGKGFLTLGDRKGIFIRGMTDFRWTDCLVDWHGLGALEFGFPITGEDRISLSGIYNGNGFKMLHDRSLTFPTHDDRLGGSKIPQGLFEDFTRGGSVELQYRTNKLFKKHIAVFDFKGVYTEFAREYDFALTNWFSSGGTTYKKLSQIRASNIDGGIDLSFFMFAFGESSLKVSLNYRKKRDSRRNEGEYFNGTSASHLSEDVYDKSYSSVEPRIEFRPLIGMGQLEFIAGGGRYFAEAYAGMTFCSSGPVFSHPTSASNPERCEKKLAQLRALKEMEPNSFEKTILEGIEQEFINASYFTSFRIFAGIRSENKRFGLEDALYLCGGAEADICLWHPKKLGEGKTLPAFYIVLNASIRKEMATSAQPYDGDIKGGFRIALKGVIADFMLFGGTKDMANYDKEKVSYFGGYFRVFF
jgi:hypothetical protein